MQKTVEQYLTDIHSKVKKLKARTQRLETENETLRKSVFQYLNQLEEMKKESSKLKDENTNDHISQSLSKDKKTLQKELDKYILMLDKCIAAIKVKS